jgi:hypothetical protein
MRWAGHVARLEKERKVCKVLVGKFEGKTPLGKPGVGGRMGSKWTLGRSAGGGGGGVDYPGSGQGPLAGSGEYDDELSGSGAMALIK